VTRRIVLASSSPFRRGLLERLQLPFEAASPEVDEAPVEGESPSALVRRLALAKARALAGAYSDALIIGSDQCAVIGGRILGKPGDHPGARRQLALASGRRVSFHTGLCLLDAATAEPQVDEVLYHVCFRRLSEDRIERYLRRERPYNCAGSFRSEGLGIALFERMEGDDPTALIGLPLIRLTAMLEAAGVEVL